MKKTLTIIILLIAVTGYSQGFYKMTKDPIGIYVKSNLGSIDTCHYTIQFAATGIAGGGWSLHKDFKDTYTYPVNGWYWFDSDEMALTGLKLKNDKDEKNRQIQ